MVEVIPLKYGTTFKRIFSQPDVFCQFVHDILGITINIDKVYTEYEYPETIADISKLRGKTAKRINSKKAKG